MAASSKKSRDRNFIIFHPSDFSKASEVAFRHALKIALQCKGNLDIMHVESHLNPAKPYWLDFPAVRATLTRWGILPEGVRQKEVIQTGLRIRKILTPSTDPLETMLRHFRKYPPDLIVLATHQREGLNRWLHRAVAEPLARRSGAMTLFVPHAGEGFIAPSDGKARLKKILVPIDHNPDSQTALEKALLLAHGLRCVGGEFRLIHIATKNGTAPVVDLPLGRGWSFETIVRQGEIVVDEILKAEADWRPDLIVLATQGHLDFLDALRGSTTERVLRGSHCPVLAVPAMTK